jgi:isoleucyl-tRNA synthetase
MLFDRPPFRNAICHGVVLDENRQKLSKRLRNYPDPLGFFDEYGSDVMRWFLISSPVLNGGDLLVPKESREIAAVQREAIAPLMNAYAFFSLYANLEARAPQIITQADDPLDRYILTKTGELAERVAAALDAYDIPKATRETVSYFDALTNWYIRRSRARFWGSEDEASRDAAFDTLYTALVRTCQICAPLLPIVTEKLYTSLTGERSVHLTLWPTADAFPSDHDLVRAMDLVRDACSAALAVRERARLRVRLPLKTLTIVHAESAGLAPFTGLIADEVNVREVALSTDLDAFGEVQLRPDPRIGKRLGKAMKEVMGAARSGAFTLNADGTASVAGETLASDEFLLAMVTQEGSAAEPFAGTGAVVLDISVDESQEREGLARDLIRAVQTARKEAGLEVSDRICLGVEGGDALNAAIQAHGAFIKAETLALSLSSSAGAGARSEVELGGETAIITVEKA